MNPSDTIADLEAKLAIARMAADNARAESEEWRKLAAESSNAVRGARAVAMEEAARWLDYNFGHIAAKEVRALAPLPSGLVVVSRETIEKAFEAGEQYSMAAYSWATFGVGPRPDRAAALALLEAVK